MITPKIVNSIQHSETRSHIPSIEEQDYLTSETKMTSLNLKPLALRMAEAHQIEIERADDPELLWLNKYSTDQSTDLKIELRPLYRHEHISPETLLNHFYRVKQDQESESINNTLNLFNDMTDYDELDKPTS